MEVNIEKDESIDDLQLNGLQLIQKNEGFRVGVDAVLLSHFANVKKKHRVIDLCTGTGIVSFLNTISLIIIELFCQLKKANNIILIATINNKTFFCFALNLIFSPPLYL